MKINKIIKIMIIFLLGVLFSNILNFYFVSGIEKPFFFNFTYKNPITPSNYINEDQIHILNNKIIIDINGASLGRYAPTGSMKPLLDENSNGIRIIPKSPKEIKIGDIITFKKNNVLIIHRVIDMKTDDKGIYYITKGDNNDLTDGKVRFNQIKYKTIGILW